MYLILVSLTVFVSCKPITKIILKLQTLENLYPNRITLKFADFFGMWKLAFKDKMDDGNRIQELLGNLATSENGMWKT